MRACDVMVLFALLGAGTWWYSSPAQGPEEPLLESTHTKAPEFPAAAAISTSSITANLPGSRPAPEQELPGPPDIAWINSSPLTMSSLHGKVVLIDFWEYTCINCIRTFAENKKWYKRYHSYGFEIIGVHVPEFDIAYPEEHVRAAVKRFGLPYPVVVDDQFKIWKSYNNSSWPGRYLIDAQGYVRFRRLGEGGDSAFEHAIRRLLQEAHPGLGFQDDDAIPPEANPFAAICGVPTPEMYVGDWYGRGTLANPEGYRAGKTITYEMAGEVQDGRVFLAGPWMTDRNGMIYRGRPKKSGPFADRLDMRYHARELYAVMNVSHGHPSRVFVEQDGKGLTGDDQGADVRLAPDGKSYIEVREPRMYYLVQNPAFGQHRVTLIPTAPGLTINSFTFGNDCQTHFPHL